ncbi:NUDIX domain-containing protein [Phycicoccus elongatus]|uniref:NUDIX domain-containing protein n=1 Tax=Phycicoccus elongatus TaxID=101689 RepID=UPI0003A32AD0|nr:NUDIX domain-containing protein [Phycicoccus elongatus]
MADVVLGALVRDGAVLLARRSPLKRHHPDIWDLPGGTVETGESELHALARELREELGVDIEPGSATHLYRVATGAGGQRTELSAWLVREWSGTPSNLTVDEHVAPSAGSTRDLPEPAHPLMRPALEAALERLLR